MEKAAAYLKCNTCYILIVECLECGLGEKDAKWALEWVVESNVALHNTVGSTVKN
jgi:hypothetical protein